MFLLFFYIYKYVIFFCDVGGKIAWTRCSITFSKSTEAKDLDQEQEAKTGRGKAGIGAFPTRSIRHYRRRGEGGRFCSGCSTSRG